MSVLHVEDVKPATADRCRSPAATWFASVMLQVHVLVPGRISGVLDLLDSRVIPQHNEQVRLRSLSSKDTCYLLHGSTIHLALLLSFLL